MANFSITVSQQPEPPYTGLNQNFSKGEVCSDVIFDIPFRIASQTTNYPDIVDLLGMGTLATAGLTLTTMYIKDIVYSDSDKLYYEYNSVKLLPSTEYEIDITGYSYNEIIPLLFLKGYQPSLNSTTQTATCKVALKDNTGLKHKFRNNTETVSYTACP